MKKIRVTDEDRKYTLMATIFITFLQWFFGFLCALVIFSEPNNSGFIWGAILGVLFVHSCHFFSVSFCKERAFLRLELEEEKNAENKEE